MTDLKDLFDTVLLEPGRDRLDVDAAVRRGRRRRRGKTLAVLGTATAVAGLAAALVVTALPHGDRQLAVGDPPAPVSGASSSQSAIASPLPEDATPVTAPDQILGTWTAVTIDGHDIAGSTDSAGHPFTLDFTDPQRGAPVEAVGWAVNTGCATSTGYWRLTETPVAGAVVSVIHSDPVVPCPMSQVNPDAARNGQLNRRAVAPAAQRWAFVAPPTATSAEQLLVVESGGVVATYVRAQFTGAPPTAAVAGGAAYLGDSPLLDPAVDTEPVTDAEGLVGHWRAVEIGGHDVHDQDADVVDLSFFRAGGSLRWEARDGGCNTVVGSASLDGGFGATATGSTLVACTSSDVPALAKIAAVTMADEARSLSLKGADQLPILLFLKDGKVLARFVQVQSVAATTAAPLDPADLKGSWRAVRIDGADVTAVRDFDGRPLTLSFSSYSDGTWHWTASGYCNSSTAEFAITGEGGLDSGQVWRTARGCNSQSGPGDENAEAMTAADAVRLDSTHLSLYADGRLLAEYARS